MDAMTDAQIENELLNENSGLAKRDTYLDRIYITLGPLCPNVCPEQLKDLHAGYIKERRHYTGSSVIKWYCEKEREYKQTHPRRQDLYAISAGERMVKIGIAHDVSQRMHTLQHMNPLPLHLVAVVKGGGRALEKQLHRKFAAERIRGEWFALSEEDLSYIKELETK